MLGSRKAATSSRNPLVAVVAPFDHRSRQALYAASHQPLLRSTWEGCALNRAAARMGHRVRTTAEAEDVFGTSHRDVVRFVTAWDRIRDDEKRSTLLRDALLSVGLFPTEPGVVGGPCAEDPSSDAEMTVS